MKRSSKRKNDTCGLTAGRLKHIYQNGMTVSDVITVQRPIYASTLDMQMAYTVMGIYTSALALLCNYTTKPLVGSGVHMPQCWVSSLLFPMSLSAHFETTATKSQLLTQPDLIGRWAAVGFPKSTPTQKRKKKSKRRSVWRQRGSRSQEIEMLPSRQITALAVHVLTLLGDSHPATV